MGDEECDDYDGEGLKTLPSFTLTPIVSLCSLPLSLLN